MWSFTSLFWWLKFLLRIFWGYFEKYNLHFRRNCLSNLNENKEIYRKKNNQIRSKQIFNLRVKLRIGIHHVKFQILHSTQKWDSNTFFALLVYIIQPSTKHSLMLIVLEKIVFKFNIRVNPFLFFFFLSFQIWGLNLY